MNILFHVGVGNHDRPNRWWGVCVIFSNLARSMEALGHNCLMYCHPAAKAESIYKTHAIYDDIDVNDLTRIKRDFKPDCVFTWNGVSEGDQKIVNFFGRQNCVFGELGFFDHYETVYFDFSGTNCKSQNIIDNLETEFDQRIFYRILKKYAVPQVRDDDYVFVVLQDEGDTNITQWSPFNNMNQLLQWTLDLTACWGCKVLYKKHPKAPCNITLKDPRLEEVTGNVHSYMRNSRLVVGCNSTALFECLLYHGRILTAGVGLTSRMLNGDRDRKRYVVHCYNKQIHQTKLADPNHIKQTWFYNKLLERYS